MAQTYLFQVSLPVTDTLARNRVVNAFHMQHVSGGLLNTDLEDIAQDIVALYQARLGNASNEVMCKVYDTDAVPNYPRATVIVNTGASWTCSVPRELALVLSYSGANSGNRRERGRMYLPFYLNSLQAAAGLRPTSGQQTWALDWYQKSNESFPDLGGVDWKFGVWSRVEQKFTQTQKAWVNDEWDIQRRRGLRETTRVTVSREG